MTKVKQHSRQIFVILLALATVVTCFFIMKPDSNAATAGKYTVRAYVKVTNDMNNCNMTVTLYGKEDNGTASSETNMGSFTWNDKNTGTSEYDIFNGETNAGVFPERINVYLANTKYHFGRDIEMEIHLVISGNDQYLTATKNSATAKTLTVTSGKPAKFYWDTDWEVFAGKNNAFNVDYTIRSSDYPYPSSVEVSGGDSSITTTAAGGNDVETGNDFSATVKDQYGVIWGATSTSWSVSNNYGHTSVTSASGDTTKVKVGPPTANVSQKTETVTATCEYNSHSASGTKTITVTPTYKLTFDKNASTATLVGDSFITKTNTDTSATTITQTVSGTTATRTGYTFKGWATYNTATSGSSDTMDGRGHNDTVYAAWEANTFKLNFDGNGATGGAMEHNPQVVTYDVDTQIDANGYSREYTVTYHGNGGEVGATTEEANIKAVYTFKGWDKDDDGTKDYDNSHNVTNLTSEAGAEFNLKALWNPDAVSLPGAERTGYKFEGWYTLPSGGDKVGEEEGEYTPTSNVDLYAQWTPQNYYITFADGYTGTMVGTEPFEYTIESTNITYPDQPSREGYTFDNTYKVQDASGNWAAEETLTNNSTGLNGKWGNVTVNAGWNPNEYTVTYRVIQPSVRVPANDALLNGGTADVVRTCTYDKKYKDTVGGMPEVTPPIGYTFAGWLENPSDTVPFLGEDGDEYVKITGPKTLYTGWTAIPYQITYDYNAGDDNQNVSFSGENPQGFNITTSFGLASASLVGYKPAAWQVVSDTTDTSWTYGQVISTGRTFERAYGNVTLAAQWTPVSAKIVYEANGGEARNSNNQPVSEKNVTYNTAVGALATGVRTGYRFEGWFLQNGDINNGNWGTQVTADKIYNKTNGFDTDNYITTVYAKWTARTYTVAFDGNEGTGSMSAQSFTFGETAKALNENGFAKTGYVFMGWALTDDATVPQFTDKQVISIGDSNILTDEQKNQDNVTVTLYAVWEKQKYTVTWMNRGNIVIDTTEVEFEGHPVHDVPTYTDAMYNYTFSFWTRNGAQVDLGTEVITAPTTYVAAYTTSPKTYNLIYRAAGEGDTQILFTVPFEFGAQTNLAAVPEKTGYNGAWTITDPADMHALPEVMPAHNITLKAVYTPIPYTVTWDLGGGAIQPQTFNYDSVPVYTGPDPTLPDDAMYTDYTFDGWAASEGGEKLDSLPVVKGDVTYYAVYKKTPRVYEIWWIQDFEDAEHGISHHLNPIKMPVAYGTVITNDMIPEITPVTGCAAAWNISALPQTMPATDVTVAAVYKFGARNIFWHTDSATVSTVQMDGEYVTYTGATPVKPETAEYTYEFKGWARLEGGTVVFDSRENATSTIPVDGVNLDFYAIFEAHAKEYTVYYYVDGGVYDQFTVAYGTVITSYPVPAKEGYTGMWGEGQIPDTMPAHDVTIEAVYNKNSYRVQWAVAGRVVTTYTLYDEKPVFPSTESKEKDPDAEFSYTFIGWATVAEAGNGDLVYSDEQIPPIGAAEVIYYAQYSKTRNSYTVTWKVDEDASHDITAVYEYGQTPVLPPASATQRQSDAQYDYSFTGWDKDIVPVEGDTTYVAQYDKQIKSYTVTWIIKHGSVSVATVEETYEYGRYPNYSGAEIEDYEDAGYDYIFEGEWSAVENGDATDDLPAVTGNATYYCYFKQMAKQFFIEWIVDGEVLDSGLFNYGEAFPQRDIPQKEGYSGSWNVSDRTVPARDVTVTAQYKANKYPVVFIGQGGITLYSNYLYYGDAIPTVDIPAEEGYTLVWDQPEVTTVPVNGVTFSLIRTINTYTLRWKNDNNDTGAVTADYHTEINVTVSAPIPEEMVVIIGDVTATEGTEFTYDPATGALKVFAQYVTADINAYSKARGNSYNVYIQIPDVEIAAAQAVVEAGGTYYARLTAMEGKLVPAAVTVYVDGEPLTRGYEYLVEQGGKAARLAIDGSAVTGTVTVEGEVRDDPNYGQNNGGNSGNNSGNSGSTSAECPYCHGHHEGFLGVIISFFHRIMYFFKSIFG